jgi:hypothetical protein
MLLSMLLQIEKRKAEDLSKVYNQRVPIVRGIDLGWEKMKTVNPSLSYLLPHPLLPIVGVSIFESLEGVDRTKRDHAHFLSLKIATLSYYDEIGGRNRNFGMVFAKIRPK